MAAAETAPFAYTLAPRDIVNVAASDWHVDRLLAHPDTGARIRIRIHFDDGTKRDRCIYRVEQWTGRSWQELTSLPSARYTTYPRPGHHYGARAQRQSVLIFDSDADDPTSVLEPDLVDPGRRRRRRAGHCLGTADGAVMEQDPSSDYCATPTRSSTAVIRTRR